MLQKSKSQGIKIPEEIRPFKVGYQVVNEYGQALVLRNGASIFDLPDLAEKALEKTIQTLTSESILLKRLLLSI